MKKHIVSDIRILGEEAGALAAKIIRKALKERGAANIILATGTSQFEILKQLVANKEINWSAVTMFHLDEYIGLPVSSRASFRKYLMERFIQKVPPLRNIFLIDGETDPDIECSRLNELIAKNPIDLALVGIGENGHLAFNDPPADFETGKPYIIVELDLACRKQQLGEGWFKSIEEVPKKAISMSIRQIMKSKTIICSVPDLRKAQAVKNCLEGPVTNLCPASILQEHSDCEIWLDQDSASLLVTGRSNLAS
jgi:glucosamine-6-phosphate deaminase